MKKKVLAFVLCACLALFAFSGCGMKMPDDSGTTPGGADGSPSGGNTAAATAVRGIVRFVDNETITLELVSQDDAQTSEGAETVAVGPAVYVTTGNTKALTPEADTTVMLANQGFTVGSLDDIKAGNFLVVVLQGDTVVAVIDAGHAKVADTGEGGVQPSVSPTDSGTDPTHGIPDTSEPATYTVITDGLKIRSGPGTEHSVLGVLDTGSRITGIISDGWIQYTYDGKTAYSSAEYIDVSAGPAGVPDSSEAKTYKTTDNLLIRSGPGTTYSSLGTLEKGTEIKGVVLGGWIKFTYNDSTAYCSAAYLTAA